jgi:hypothetical protein
MEIGPSGGAAHAAQAPQTQQAAIQQNSLEAKEQDKAVSQLQADKPAQAIGSSGHNINISV